MVLSSTSLHFWKKAKKKLLGEASLRLVWTEIEAVTEKRGKDADSHFRLGVIFPSQRWSLVFKSEVERNKLLQKINDAIKAELKTDVVPAGTLEITLFMTLLNLALFQLSTGTLTNTNPSFCFV